ncbi:MAG: DUF692 family protein [Deltaproteobacteria bacterium]|nr:DUF692 family protein [Deltaproteobacteria bacterium]
MGSLPRLGLGLSTEYGAHRQAGALDPFALAAAHPTFASFLEVGVEVAVGLDADARRWAAEGRPTTYHFLDVNLDEPEDLDAPWLERVRAIAAELRPAWMCGDAGLWHFGPRERGHMLLLPPILTAASADALADGIAGLRDAVGLEVLPENPPGHVFLGDLHMLEFFARVAERADTGLLIDCAHLAIYQQIQGLPWDAALDVLPFERVVELHVAGGTARDHEGFPWIDDDHRGGVLEATWSLVETFVARAPNLKAVVFECERNALPAVLPTFERLAALWPAGAGRVTG